MKTCLQKLNLFVYLLLFSLLSYSQSTKTTYDFLTDASLTFTGYWYTQADITIAGTAFRISNGINGSYSNAATGGASNSKCLMKEGSGGDSFTLQRVDGQPFQFYGIWVKHESMNSYSQFYSLPPWYTLTANTFSYQDNTARLSSTGNTLSTQTISAGADGVTTTSVQISFQAIMYFWIDDIVVGPAPSIAPTATTGAASSITASGATLNGSINANNASTIVTFEYGLTTGYGASVTATPSPVTGSTATSVSKAITGLSANTTYHYRVKGVNAGGTTNGFDQTFTTLIAAPTISSVSVPSNATYITSQNLDFTVNYSEAITVTGTPYIPITLNTGGTVSASYVSGSGTSALVFRYSVVSGNADNDGISVGSAIALNGGTLKNGSSVDALLTLNSVASTTGVKVDAIAPTLASTMTISDTALKIGDTATLTFTFNEAITGFTTADLTAPNGTVSSLSSSDGGVTWTANFTPIASVEDATNVITLDYTGIADLAGNAGLGSATSVNYAVDTVRPTIPNVSSSTANGTYKQGDVIVVTVMFSEAVTLTGTPTLALNTGATVSYPSGNGTTVLTFSYTVGSGESSADLDYLATNSLALAGGTIKDAAGNDAILTLPTVGGPNSLGGQKDILIAINPSSGGTIAADQAGCYPFIPNEITSSALPSGYVGTLEYKWQSSTTSSSAGFSDIAGSNAATYDPGSLTVDTWYKRLARVDFMNDWTGAAESNVIKMTVSPLPTVNTLDNQDLCNGSVSTAINFSGTGTVFDWTNDTPGIGLAASGSGNISSFSVVNSTNAPVTANITVTPFSPGMTSAPIPELLYYKFNGSGTSVPNLASSPPVGSETATIMGTLTQGGSGICAGTLIGSGNIGTTDYLDTKWVTNLSGTSWTISFKTSNITPSSTLFYIFGDPSASSFRCFTNGVAGANNWILRGVGLADVLILGGATVAPHTITIVYDNNAGNIKAYLDGVLNNTVSQATSTISGTGSFQIGAYASSTGLNSGGLMDEFRIYNRALSLNEVETLTSCPPETYCSGSPKTFTITVNPTPIAPTAGSNSYTYDGTAKTATANVGAGETVDWYASATGTTTASAPAEANVGTYSAYAETRNITTGCTSANRTLITLEITKATLTVTADAQTKAYGDANPTLTFQYSGWKNSETDAVLTTKPSATTTVTNTTSVGTYTDVITLSGGADENYAFTYVPADFSVTAATLTVTADAQTKVYGDANPTLTFQYSGWKNSETDAVLTTKPTASTTVTNTTSVGTYTDVITVSGGADENYAFTYVPADFSVTAATLTVTADAQTKVYGDANPTLTFQYSGWKNSETDAVLDTKPTALTTVDLLTNVGTHTNAITVSGGTDNNYAFSYEAADFLVTAATLTVTADAQTKAYGDVNPTLTFQYSGWKNSDTESVLDTQPIATTTVTVTTSPGTYYNAITVSGGSDNNYNFTYIPASFTVNKGELIIWLDPKTKVYGDENPTLTYRYTGFMNGDDESDLDYKPYPTTSVTKGTNAGTYTSSITMTGGLDANYSIVNVPANFTVNKALLTVTADSQAKAYGEINPVLTFTYSGWKNGENESVLDVKPVVSTTVNTTTILGVYKDAIFVQAGSDNNYKFDYVAGTFTVTQASQSIVFNALTPKTYGDEPFTLSAISNSGLTISYTCSDSDVAVVSGNTVSIIGAGTAVISASQSGDSNYFPAETVSQTLTVNRKPLFVEGITAASKIYDGNANAALIGGTLSGTINSDVITLSNATTGTFSQTSAGTEIPVATTMTISGEDAANYTLASPILYADITAKTVTVTAQNVERTCAQPEQPLTYSFEPALIGTDTFTGTLTRPEGNAPGVYPITLGTLSLGNNYAIQYVGASYTLINTPNLAPVVDPVANLQVLKNSKEATVNLTGIDPVSNCIAQQIESITASAENKTLIPEIKVDYISGESTAKLTLKIADGLTGETTIKVVLKDNGGTENYGTDSKEMVFNVKVDTPVGINDMVNSFDASVYPNPTKGQVKIKINGTEKSTVRISNSAGIEVFRKTDFADPLINIDLSDKTPGLYLVEISNGKSVIVKKLIITN